MSETIMRSLNTGYCALVIGASGGIGQALVRQLEMDRRCGRIVCLSRFHDGLELTDEQSVVRAADALKAERFDLIICATGVLTVNGVGPEKALRQVSQSAMMTQFAVNAVGPALILKHFVPLLAKGRRVIVAMLSARVGSINDNVLGGWISYRASKAALNQIVRTAAIEVTRTNPWSLVIAVHPGTVDTPLSAGFSSRQTCMEPKNAAGQILWMLDGLESGHTGGFFAYDGTSIDW